MTSLCGLGGAANRSSAKLHARKILVVGDGACGKTSLLNVLTQGFFPQAYEPTVFENYVHNMVLPDGRHMELSLWDTAGQEDFAKLRSLSYSDTHCIIICFSTDNPVSLENVESKWIQEVHENCPGVKVVLAALKCDLREDQRIAEKLEQYGEEPVTYEQGLQVAKRINAARYLECSAKLNRGVEECFAESAKVAIDARAKGRDKTQGGGIVCTIA